MRGRDHTEAERLYARDVRKKYRWWRKVDPEDSDAVRIFRDLGLAKIRKRDGEMYARMRIL